MERSLENDIIATAESFTNNFANRGNFDYSVESLKAVDVILEELGDYVFEEDTLHSASSMAGCYIFEVARRNYGGEYYWVKEKGQPLLITGKPDYSVSIYAFEKARGRIENGEEDSIQFYFDGYIEAVEKGKATGYCATII